MTKLHPQQISAAVTNVTGEAYTLGFAAAGGLVRINNATGATITLPADSAAGIAPGVPTQINNVGEAPATFTAGAGAALVTTGNSIPAGASGLLIKTAANTWAVLVGAAGSEPEPAPFDPTYGWTNSNTSITEDGQATTSGATGTGTSFYTRAGEALTGKKYFEVILDPLSDPTYARGTGVSDETISSFFNAGAWVIVSSNGGASLPAAGYYKNGAKFADGSASYGQGDVVGVAFDAGTGKIWYSLNGVFFGDPAAGTGENATLPAGTYYPYAGGYTTSATTGPSTHRIYPRADQQAYPAPAGFSAYDPG